MLVTFSILFVVAILGIQLFVTISGKDAWPFSSYRMFSTPFDSDELTVFRVALERLDGDIVWWQSRFYRYPQQIGKQIRQLYDVQNDSPRTRMVVALETQKILIEVARLIRLEEGGLDSYQAFHVIERKGCITEDRDITIEDKTIVRIPFQDLSTEFGESNN